MAHIKSDGNGGIVISRGLAWVIGIILTIFIFIFGSMLMPAARATEARLDSLERIVEKVWTIENQREFERPLIEDISEIKSSLARLEQAVEDLK